MTVINHHLKLLVLATGVQRAGGDMLPWETPVGLVEARRRFGEDEDEEFEDYDFDENEEELDEDEDEDFESLDEDDEDYDDIEEDFDDDGEPRSPKRRKNWE